MLKDAVGLGDQGNTLLGLGYSLSFETNNNQDSMFRIIGMVAKMLLSKSYRSK